MAKKEVDPSSPWLTVLDVARLAKTDDRLVYRAVRSGQLRSTRIGNKLIRIHREWAEEWLNPDGL